MSNIVELSQKDFTSSGQLKNYKDKLVLIKFYTTWCGYCKRAIPDYEELGKRYKGDKKVIIAKVDADKNEELINIFNGLVKGPKVHGFPTILLFKNNLYKDKFDESRTVEAYINFLNQYY